MINYSAKEMVKYNVIPPGHLSDNMVYTSRNPIDESACACAIWSLNNAGPRLQADLG